jgi:prokaryotic ubiquitin-like protein Pup
MKLQERKQTRRHEPQGKEEAHASTKIVEAGKRMKEDIDKLTEDIDEVLERNAEEFVRSYVQRGGE